MAPLFTGGRIVNEARAAEQFQEAAGHRLVWTRTELVYQVSDVFYAILAQERVIDSLDASRKALESHLEHTQALVAAEKAPPVDQMRIDVRLADIRQEMALEKHVMTTYCRGLANFMGISNADAQFSLAGKLDRDAGRAPPGLDEALATAWRERKDYLAARADYEAFARRVDAARAGYWPTFSVTGSYGGRWNVGPATEPGDDRGEVGHAGIELYMPLFEGGRIDARVRERRAELAAARERLRELELHVIQDIGIALSNIHVSRERAAAVQKTMGLAHESLRIERQRHGLGRVSALEVLDAQSVLLESEITYYRALAELHAAIARLGLAMGAL